MDTEFIPDRFREQVALVVGGAQGIGKAISMRLAREGANVVVGDIDKVMLKRTATQIAKEGCSARTVLCDVRKPLEVERMVAQVMRWYKRLDILMYIAGVVQSLAFEKTSEQDWNHTLDINLKGAFLSARSVVPHMIKRGRGKLVFMSSTNAWRQLKLKCIFNFNLTIFFHIR